MKEPAGVLRAASSYIAHVVVVCWLFAGALFLGRVFFFRDVNVLYYPNYVFLERSFGQGVWPLWNPTDDAGAPFLASDPVDLALVAGAGARTALRLAPPLQVLLAMCGVTALARRMGIGAWGSWTAGALFGLSGYLLSTLNLFPVSHGVAWAPLVLWAYLGLIERPSPRRAAVLGAIAALQLSTLSGETIIQTAVIGLVLTPRRPERRTLAQLLLAAAIALLLSAPTLLGTRALLEGTERMAGFDRAQSLAYSVHPLALMEALLPRFLGDPHTFSDVGYWGQSLFPAGYPYLISLYLGPTALMLAARGGGRRLWVLCGLGILVALGSYGPLQEVWALLMRPFRGPVKFLLLADLPVCLMAGIGVERAMQARSRLLWIVPGAALMAASFGLDWAGPGLSRFWPATRDPRALHVMATSWPGAFAVTGALCLGAGVVLWRGGRLAGVAALLAVLDLLIVNDSVNPTAEASFYELRPEVRSLLSRTEGSRERWLSFGVERSRPRWSPWVASRNSDFWLYYMERQSLLPRTTVLDGLDTVFNEARNGWEPPGSTLTLAERRPESFPAIADRLRRASVRWVLSWKPLPPELAALEGEARLPAIEDPLRLYELRGWRPRAFWSPGGGEPDPRGTVALARPDPHHIHLEVAAPPGLVVVTETYHPGWHVQGPSGALPLRPVDGRYMGFETRGGEETYDLRFEPAWRAPALALFAAGCALVGVLGLRRADGAAR